MLVCPICREPFLPREGQCLRCVKGHSFDISSAGHCNLLLTSKPGNQTGDNKEMVAARRHFLEKDYYKPLADAVSRKVNELTCSVPEPCIVDAGCGEGYYTRKVTSSLRESGKMPQVIGIDISKHASLMAAKRDKHSFYITASAFSMPVEERCAHVILSLFAPLSGAEFQRVLSDDGTVLCALPGECHLWELKQAVYDKAYKNREDKYQLEGFCESTREKISYSITLKDAESIRELFAMTPYFFKTSREGLSRLDALHELSVTLEFLLIEFKKL